MGGSSRTSTTEQSATRDPWAPALPLLNAIGSGALDAYNSGVGSQVYQGPRVAGMGDTTQAGLNYLSNNAGAGLGTAMAGNSLLGTLLGNGGATADTRSATQGLLGVGGVDTNGIRNAADRLSNPNNTQSQAANALTGGAYNLDASGYRALDAGLAGPSQTQQSLQDVADGKYLGGANPYLDNMISQAQAAASNQVRQSFANSGRYGSGMFTGALADATGRAGTQLRYDDYNRERERQAQAAQAIDGGLLSRTSARSGLLGAINDTRGANANQLLAGANLASNADQASLAGQQSLANALQANNSQQINQYTTALQSAQADRSAALSGLGAVSGVQNSLLQPGRTLAGVGAAQDTARQQEIDALREQFAEEQQAPWRQVGLLSAIGLPLSGVGGTSTGRGTTTEESDPGLFNSIFGGLLGIGGTAANIGKGAPGLMALFSDERLKEDIRPVGKLNDGQTIYSYKMAGEPRTQLGLLAQEVADHRPSAVHRGPGGLLMVDYAEATADAAAKPRARGARK